MLGVACHTCLFKRGTSFFSLISAFTPPPPPPLLRLLLLRRRATPIAHRGVASPRLANRKRGANTFSCLLCVCLVRSACVRVWLSLSSFSRGVYGAPKHARSSDRFFALLLHHFRLVYSPSPPSTFFFTRLPQCCRPLRFASSFCLSPVCVGYFACLKTCFFSFSLPVCVCPHVSSTSVDVVVSGRGGLRQVRSVRP